MLPLDREIPCAEDNLFKNVSVRDYFKTVSWSSFLVTEENNKISLLVFRVRFEPATSRIQVRYLVFNAFIFTSIYL
jgi:hypothetical protein